MPNNMRDRLIELIQDIKLCNPTNWDKPEFMALALLANGVIFMEKRYKCPKCGRILTPRADNKSYFCFDCMNEFTREDAVKALREREGE